MPHNFYLSQMFPIRFGLSKYFKIRFCNVIIFINSHSVKPCSCRSASCCIDPCPWRFFTKSINCSNYCCKNFLLSPLSVTTLSSISPRYIISISKWKVVKIVLIHKRKLNDLFKFPFRAFTKKMNVVSCSSAFSSYRSSFIFSLSIQKYILRLLKLQWRAKVL